MSLGQLLRAAADRFREAGIDAPEHDARTLLAHALGRPGHALALGEPADPHLCATYGALVERRCRREPLQHLIGRAHFRHLSVAVGPGVFVPRPETEVMTGWAVGQLRRMAAERGRPLAVDLGTGSGAIAKAIATEVVDVDVHAVELSEDAARWAARNLADTSVNLHVGDMASALPELDGQVDLVVANPPYIPLDAYASVAPEARDYDPVTALFSGADGLDAIRVVADVAARLLRPGGLLCVEHAEVQDQTAPAVLVAHGGFQAVRDHQDLTGRPRFVTAVRRRLVLAGWDE